MTTDRKDTFQPIPNPLVLNSDELADSGGFLGTSAYETFAQCRDVVAFVRRTTGQAEANGGLELSASETRGLNHVLGELERTMSTQLEAWKGGPAPLDLPPCIHRG